MNAAASHSTIYKAVLNGSMKSILDEVKAGLAQGMEPGMIVSDELIPAINEVGDLFEQQKYFLPQLIASAETMKKAIEYLEPMLSSGDETGPKVTIVIATVEGDIHDIGKNLVALMLKNYGFRVVDLGKDVPKEDIVQAAIDEKADIIVCFDDNYNDADERCSGAGKRKTAENQSYHRRCGYHTELCRRNRSRWIFERCGRCRTAGAAVARTFIKIKNKLEMKSRQTRR